MPLPIVLCPKLEAEIEETPIYLLDLLKKQTEIIWEEDFMKNSSIFELYKEKIVAVISWYGKPKVSETCILKPQ